MSNEINRIYSFLATFGDKDDWCEKADKNGDGAITINEFRSLINSDWNVDSLGNIPKNDVINNFFRKFDDNKSGANKDRIKTNNGSVSNLYAWSSAEYNDEELQNNVEKFVKINEALADSVVASSINNLLAYLENGQEQNECRGNITIYLSNELIKLNTTDVSILVEKAKELVVDNKDLNKIIAQHMGDDIRISMANNATISKLGNFYDIFQDKDLQAIINSKVSNFENLETLKQDLKTEIEKYIKTANTGRREGADISDSTSSLSTGGLNTIQMAKMEQTVHNAIKDAKIPEGFPKYDLKTYETAVMNFIMNSEYCNNQDYLTNLASGNIADDFFKSKQAEAIKSTTPSTPSTPTTPVDPSDKGGYVGGGNGAGGTNNEIVEIPISDDNNNINNFKDIKLQGESICDILKNKKAKENIQLTSFVMSSPGAVPATVKTNAKNAIRGILVQLKSPLIEAGIAAERVEWAIKATINYYDAAIEAIFDRADEGSGETTEQMSFSYKLPDSDKTEFAFDSFVQYTGDNPGNENMKTWDECLNITEGCGLCLGEYYNYDKGSNSGNDNAYAIAINKYCLLKTLQNFLSKFPG